MSKETAFQKMDFPSYFQKVIWVGGTHFFRRHFYLKKPNTPEYAQVLVLTCPKINSVTALFSPPPPTIAMWSQNIIQVASCGLGILQRCWKTIMIWNLFCYTSVKVTQGQIQELYEILRPYFSSQALFFF